MLAEENILCNDRRNPSAKLSAIPASAGIVIGCRKGMNV